MSKLLNYLDRLEPGYVAQLERKTRRDNLEVWTCSVLGCIQFALRGGGTCSAHKHSHPPDLVSCPGCGVQLRLDATLCNACGLLVDGGSPRSLAGQHTHGPRAAISERKACPRCREDWRFAKEMRRVHRSKVHPGEIPVVRWPPR